MADRWPPLVSTGLGHSGNFWFISGCYCWLGKLHIGLLLLSLLAMIFLHMAANMLSDVVDWRRGLDREMTPASGALARGWLTPRQVLRGSDCFLPLVRLWG